MQSELPARAAEDPGTGDQAGSSKTALTLTTLPLEIQKGIVKHVPRKYLKHLQLVSKHFHELASAEIYNNLEFFLTHPDSLSYWSFPSFRPTYALHTFVTSSHNYAQYVRTFGLFMSEQDTDENQRRIASKYHFQEDAARLLNTALLLMVRRANGLERFIWDVPIDLDPDVFRTLSTIKSLHCLHIRYETMTIPRVTYHPPPPPLPNPPVNPPLNPIGQAPLFSSQGVPSSSTAAPYVIKLQRRAFSNWRVERKTLSNFIDLRELSVIGIDNMEIVGQAATAMQQCSIGLKSVKFTLSSQFARKARRPANGGSSQYPMIDPLDEDDDDVTQPNTPSAPTPAPLPAVNEADIRKEQKAQESILARIFGFGGVVASDKKVDKSLKVEAAKIPSIEDRDEIFMQQLKDVVTKMAKVKGMNPHNNSLRANFFGSLEKAVDKYLGSKADKKKAPSQHYPSQNLPSWAGKAPKYKFPANTPPLPKPSNLMSDFDPYAPASSSSAADPKPKAMHDEFGNISYDKFTFDPFPPKGLPPPPQSQNKSNYSPSWPQALSSSAFASGLPPHPAPYTLQNSSSSSNPFGSSSTQQLDGNVSLYLPSSSTQPYNPSSKAPLAYPSWDYAHPLPPSSSKSPLAANVYSPSSPSFPSVEPPGPNGGPLTAMDSGSSESGDDEATSGMDGTKSPGYVDQDSKSPEAHEDEMGVDMDHPDTDDDSGEETDVQIESSGTQSRAETSGVVTPNPLPNGTAIPTTSSKANGVPEAAAERQLPTSSATGKAAAIPEVSAPEGELTPEEQMREYIRMKHGFSLEQFSLYLVPLKPSILAKALDLSSLQSLSLLSVGPQGAFWTLMEKHHTDFKPLQLHSIHTDDVSLAFLSCINKLSDLEELFLVKRNSKELDCTTTKVPASLNDIRTLALRKHIGTLQRLSIVNNDDDSWDLDGKCFRLIAAKGAVLEELAFNVELVEFHTFIQCLPRIASLVAVNIITLRAASTDRMSAMARECRKFLLDVCQYYPQLRLKYVATLGFVHEIGEVRRSSRHPRRAPPGQQPRQPSPFARAPLSPAPRAASARRQDIVLDAKGKGKAPVRMIGGVVVPPPAPEPAAPPDVDEHGESFDEIESATQDVIFVRHMKYCDVPDVEIFTRQIRLGRV